MGRFIDIIENAMPSAKSDVQSEMVNMLAKLLNKEPSIEVVSTAKPEELQIRINDTKITLCVTSVSEGIEEDNEALSYNLDKSVEGLAAKAKGGALGWAAGKFGSSYQKAKTAVKEREDVAKDGIDVYQRVTQNIRKAIQSSKKDLNTSVNVI